MEKIINTMKVCETYAEAKQNAVSYTDEDGKNWIQYPPYHDYIEGVDYGDLNPEPILMPAMLVG
jgi:hypothetical protein